MTLKKKTFRPSTTFAHRLEAGHADTLIDLDEEEQCCDVSMEPDSTSSETLSDPNDDDSPHYRRAKLKRIWKREVQAINVLVEDLMTSQEPNAPSVQSLAEWHAAEIAAVNAFTADLLTPSASFHPLPDAVEDAIEEFDLADTCPPPLSEKTRPCKYGRCPRCKVVLYPHLHKHSQSSLWGTILLRCSNFKNRLPNGKPECWFNQMLSSEQRELLPKSLLRAEQEIRKDVSWQLRNPR